MHKYIVCIGSNYNRTENLTFARQKLAEQFSPIYRAPELETEPLFFKNPALFSNQVIMFFSDKDEELVCAGRAAFSAADAGTKRSSISRN